MRRARARALAGNRIQGIAPATLSPEDRRGSHALHRLVPGRPIPPIPKRSGTTRSLPAFPGGGTGLSWIVKAALLAVLASLLLGESGEISAQARKAPLRLGIYHPRPRFCAEEELSQRDLRVIRMGFRLFRTPGQRNRWPWYLSSQALPPAAGGRRDGFELALRTEALWGRSLFSVIGRHPEFPGTAGVDRLSRWREKVSRDIPALQPAPLQSRAQFRREGLAPLPFLPGRLTRSDLLPFLSQEVDSAGTPAACRTWPAGVEWLPGEAKYTYVLRSRSGEGEQGGNFDLRGYRKENVLWRDYLWGRLDAMLLEGPDLTGRVSRYRASQLGAWGVTGGGQQIGLRFHPKFAAALGREGRRALSLALGRAALGRLEGPARFGAATEFLQPLLERSGPGSPPGLRYDTRQARKMWLNRKRKPAEARLGVLNHPWLKRIGRGVREHWSRTLNFQVELTSLSPYLFFRAVEEGEVEMYLDVADLDDGSLQDLWREPLAGRRDFDIAAGPEPWEALLREDLPYLPLLTNLHYVLLRKKAAPDLLPRICPACRRVKPPLKLRAEYRERVNPEG